MKPKTKPQPSPPPAEKPGAIAQELEKLEAALWADWMASDVKYMSESAYAQRKYDSFIKEHKAGEDLVQAKQAAVNKSRLRDAEIWKKYEAARGRLLTLGKKQC